MARWLLTLGAGSDDHYAVRPISSAPLLAAPVIKATCCMKILSVCQWDAGAIAVDSSPVTILVIVNSVCRIN